jgi:hypothetical protein
MSLNATAATAPTSTLAVGSHHHGHKKAAATDAATESASDTPGQPQTTQGLFSSLLSSLEQTVGVVNPAVGTALSVITPASALSSPSSTHMLAQSQTNRLSALPQLAQGGSPSASNALGALGAKLNATA